MKRLVITESEKNSIISKHINQIPININEVVISDWLSPDEKYVIFLDELYDLENKTKLGDIWKTPSNLILFLEHTFRVSNMRQDIKESASKILNKNLLTEGVEDLTYLKPLMKEFLINEDFWNDTWLGKGLGYAGKFVKDTAVDTVSGIYNFGKDLVVGGAKLGKEALTGNWGEVWNLLKQGTKWLARKIRQAVYSPVGIIIDTILVATGIGKVPQAVVWAIVVSLDIYEFVTGDYEHKEEPMWLRIVFFLIDILGLVSAGAAAGGARAIIKGIGGSLLGLEKSVAKSPVVRKTLESMVGGLKKLPAKLAEWGTMLGKGQFGKLFKMALGNVGKFINWIIENLKSTWKSPALKSVLVNTGLVVGIGTGVEAYKDYKETKNKEDLNQAKLDQEKEDEAYDELATQVANKNIDMSGLLT